MKKLSLCLVLIAVCALCCTFATACGNNTNISEQTQEIPPVPTVKSITVSGQNTEFYYGDEFKFGKGNISCTLSDGTMKNVNISECTLDDGGFDPYKCDEYTVKLGYGERMCEYKVKVKPAKKLKYLIIGNSFSDDTNRYMSYLADGMGFDREDVFICNLFHPACSLTSHWNHKGEKYYHYRDWFDSSTTSISDKNYESSLEDGVKHEKWDYIIFQQASDYSGKQTSYGKLSLLLDYVETVFKSSQNYNPNVKYAFNMTWAYRSDSSKLQVNNGGVSFDTQLDMYNAIANSVKGAVVPEKRIVLISPAGTAIQNARTSYLGDTFNRDESHLSMPVGCMISAMSMFCTLTGYQPEEINYTMTKLSDEKVKSVIVESVKNALNNKFVCTTSAITK